MTHTPIKLKTVSLTLSSLIATACLAMPLTALADTSDSIDAIMEQMKSLKTPTPKVSTPEPEKTESKVEEKKAEEPVKTEEKPVEEAESSVYVAPQKVEKQQTSSSSSAVEQASTPKATKKKRKSKKRRARRQASNKGSAVDYKGFDEQYMSLINDILNEKEPTSSSSTPDPVPAQATQGGNFAGISGWIYLGKYSGGRWLASKSLKSGNSLPVAGQQYTVKSPMLNMRKTRPLKSGLGKLLQVLHIGDQVQVNRVHRSANNNYWANIVRP